MIWRLRRKTDWQQWLDIQLKAFSNGEEIVPPWVAFPGSEPWWGGWRQGISETWFRYCWFPFWSGLSNEAKASYIEKWNTTVDWYEHLMTDKISTEYSLKVAKNV